MDEMRLKFAAITTLIAALSICSKAFAGPTYTIEQAVAVAEVEYQAPERGLPHPGCLQRSQDTKPAPVPRARRRDRGVLHRLHAGLGGWLGA